VGVKKIKNEKFKIKKWDAAADQYSFCIFNF